MLKQFEKFIPGQLVEKLLQNENLIGGVLKAVSVSSEIKELIEHQCKQTLHSLSLAPLEEVEDLKEEVSRLESDIQVLKDQLIHLAQTSTIELTQAKSELKTAKAKIQSLNKKLKNPAPISSEESASSKVSDSSSSIKWTSSMTKAQLIDAAAQQGLHLAKKLTKAQIIDEIKAF